MGDKTEGGQPRGETKAGGKGRPPGFRRLFHFERWSLRARFLYFTGMLLAVGCACLVAYFSHVLEHNLDKSARERLGSVAAWLDGKVRLEQDYLLSQVEALASVPVVRESLADEDRERLKGFILPYAERIRLSLGLETLAFHFFHPPATSFLRSVDLESWGEDISADPVVNRVERERTPLKSVRLDRDGPRVVAAAPVNDGSALVGGLMALVTLEDLVDDLSLGSGFGVAVLAHGSDMGMLDMEGIEQQAGSWLVMKRMGALSPDLAAKALTSLDGSGRVGDVRYTLLSLPDYMGRTAAGLLVVYDASELRQVNNDKIALFAVFFLAGAVFTCVFLYINVVRVERFFTRLKRILISSHANYFGERFDTDHVHCLEALHCHNEECPVYKDPSLVCYLETGSEAISPQWRDTCVHLNRYDTCAACPVYALRRGDELAEMQAVTNTLMRLWSGFLGRVGHLMAYVLRTPEQSGQLPSLDEVSNRLEQMAKLTFFGKDLQGVLDRDEVYRQLAHVFKGGFGLRRFVLFEVEQDLDRIVLALDHAEEEPLCKRKVLISAEACRAKRVAEDVVSFFNPVLCPHFNCDHGRDVRCCLPMVMSGHVGAVFSFLAPKREWEDIRRQIPVMRKYLDEAAPVLSSLRLLALSKEQALRDPLTHCHNRRFLDEFLTKYEPLSERDGRRTGFLMADLDYFKQVNDQYGHEAGDAVLQQVVRILHESIRRSDLVIRYGGEEFLVLLQDVRDNAGMEVAEKIRQSVESEGFDVGNGQRIQKTISIGVAYFPDDAQVLYKAIKFADVALYEAKNRGRNQVVRFSADMWVGEDY